MKLGLNPVAKVEPQPEVPNIEDFLFNKIEVLEASNAMAKAVVEYEDIATTVEHILDIRRTVAKHGADDALLTMVSIDELNKLSTGFSRNNKEEILNDIDIALEAQNVSLADIVGRIWKFLVKMINKIIKLFTSGKKQFTYELNRVSKLKNPSLPTTAFDGGYPEVKGIYDNMIKYDKVIVDLLIQMNKGSYDGAIDNIDSVMTDAVANGDVVLKSDTSALTVDNVIDDGKTILQELIVAQDLKKLIDGIKLNKITVVGEPTVALESIIPKVANIVTVRYSNLMKLLYMITVVLSSATEATPSKEEIELEAERVEAERVSKLTPEELEAERIAKLTPEELEAEKTSTDDVEAKRVAGLTPEELEAEKSTTTPPEDK